MKLVFRKIAGILAVLLLIISYQKEGFAQIGQIDGLYFRNYGVEINNAHFQIEADELPDGDLRKIQNAPPFPIVFYYGPGNAASRSVAPFLIMNLETEAAIPDLPDTLKDALARKNINISEVPVYLAVTNLPYFENKGIGEVRGLTFNYFHHFWVHRNLTANIDAPVETGSFSPGGIAADGNGNMLATERLKAFSQHFHDRDMLSPNNVQFRLQPNHPVKHYGSWFLSIAPNDGNRTMICYYMILGDMEMTEEAFENREQAQILLEDIATGRRIIDRPIDWIGAFQGLYQN